LILLRQRPNHLSYPISQSKSNPLILLAFIRSPNKGSK